MTPACSSPATGARLQARRRRRQNSLAERVCRQDPHPLLLPEGQHAGLHHAGLRLPRRGRRLQKEEGGRRRGQPGLDRLARQVPRQVQPQLPAPVRSRPRGRREVRRLGRQGPLRQEVQGHHPLDLRHRRQGQDRRRRTTRSRPRVTPPRSWRRCSARGRARRPGSPAARARGAGQGAPRGRRARHGGRRQGARSSRACTCTPLPIDADLADKPGPLGLGHVRTWAWESPEARKVVLSHVGLRPVDRGLRARRSIRRKRAAPIFGADLMALPTRLSVNADVYGDARAAPPGVLEPLGESFGRLRSRTGRRGRARSPRARGLHARAEPAAGRRCLRRAHRGARRATSMC